MPLTKFEHKIKEKLEDRSIVPSGDLWELMSNKLDSSTNNSKKLVWYFIAASFIGIAFTTIFFTNNTLKSLPNTEVVIKDTIKLKSIKIIPQITSNDKEVPQLNIRAVSIKKEKITLSPFKQDNRTKQIDQKNEEDKTKLSIKEIEPKEAIDNRVINTNIIKDKAISVLAQIDTQKLQSNGVSDDEITQLLQQAQLELTAMQTNSIYNTISAEALLQDVEEELDENFRKRVFEALKAQFYKAKEQYALSRPNN